MKHTTRPTPTTAASPFSSIVVISHGEDPYDIVARLRRDRPAAAVCPFVVPRDVLDEIEEAADVRIFGLRDLSPGWDDISAAACRDVAEILHSAPAHDGWEPLVLCAERIAGDLTFQRRQKAFLAGSSEVLGRIVEPPPFAPSARLGRGMGNPLRRAIASFRHRTWPMRARHGRIPDSPTGGTWAVSSYLNYGRAMARASNSVGGIDGLLLLGPGGTAGIPWGAVVPGPALAPLAAASEAEALRSYLLRATEGTPGDIRSVVEAISNDRHLLHGWADAAKQAEAFLDRIRPDRVVVGNEYSVERVFAELAQRRGVTIELVLHGLPHGLYRHVPLIARQALVWEDRWRDYFAPSTSERINTFQPLRRGHASIVSVYTSPCRMVPFASEEFTRAVLLEGAAKISESLDLPLVIRLHPADLPGAERRAVRRLRQSHPAVSVRVDRSGDPYDVLATSAITVTAHSTVTAESVASGIPSLTVDLVDSDAGRWLATQSANVGYWRDSFDQAVEPLRPNILARAKG